MINELLNVYQSLDQLAISGHANLQQLTNAMDTLGGVINSLKEHECKSELCENVEESVM